MNLSMRWLGDYVRLDKEITPRAYSAALTMSGSKVEGYEVEGSEIDKVVVGKVLSIVKHPNADSLVICQVDVGAGQPVQIVTGATNVVEGALVPVALDGSTLPGGKKIHKGKLRGEVSEGMMCSLGELGLTVHDFPYAIEDGIFLLEEDCQVGQDIRSAIGFDDTCVEFEITSNRPDCLSVLGLARETAATYQKPLTLPHPAVEKTADDIHNYLSVEVKNPELCPRYIARMAKNIKIEPSPRWMRERLRASGVRPINNIVDITNYVMLEYGQPMHAFDYQYVKGGKIIVRNAADGETITTLDDVKRTLTPDMLVIADESAPTAVAGVMGGEFSGINENTHMIVFESANFKGSSVRITAKKLGMRTEASGRYEKGLDPQCCLPAVERACQLVEQLGAGEIMGGMIDVDHSQKEPHTIPFTPDWINRFLGIEIPAEQMLEILARVEVSYDKEKNLLICPSFRADLEEKADIAEEVARFYGYDKIPVTAIRGVAEAAHTPRQKFDRKVQEILLGCGLHEVITYSFISPKYYDKIRLPGDSPLRRSVVISNPLGEDTSVMRTTAIPSMMEVLSRNYNNRNPSAWMYEVATEYHPKGEDQLPDEIPNVVIGLYGSDADYFTLKGMAELLLERLGIEDWDIEAVTDNPTFHPGRCARLTAGGEEIGLLGEIHPAVCENYGIGTKVYLAKLDADRLFALGSDDLSYHPLPRFPATSRDIALLCDDRLPVRTLEKAIRAAAGNLLEKLELFDVYKGQQIPEGKKSVAMSLTLRAADRTLTDEESDGLMAKVVAALEKVGAYLRS